MGHRTAVARVLLCICAFAAFAGNSWATPETDGISWLSRQPQANGSLANESGSIATAFQARTETIVTLKQFGTNAAAVADTVAVESHITTEYTGRKAWALAPLSRDVSASLAALLAFQNADGGFGAMAGYVSNPLDTAYALLALKAAGSANGGAISKALGYLTSAQAPDGSYAVSGEAALFVTAYALQAMNAFAQAYALTTPIQSAKGWLVSQQAAGVYPTTLENAVATIALAGATVDSTAFSASQAALKAAQLPDGSWSTDPYLTAIVIRALAATASAPPPATTGQVSGSVVEQASGAPLSGVQVNLTGPQPSSTTSDASGAFAIASLAPGSYTLQLSKAGYGTVTLPVTITAGVASNVGTVRLQVSTTTASLQGIVRDAANGQPVSGATVTVGSNTATTDASGAYQLAGLIPGAVTITVAKSGYQGVTVSASLSAGVITSFSPGLYATGSSPTDATLRGRIVDRATGAAVSGATVQVGSSSAASDANGQFSIASLATGTITLQVSAAGYVAAAFSATLAPGVNDAGNIAIDRQPASVRLSGRVSDAAGGAPIGGATVRVTGTTLTASTNANGLYQIDGITQTQFSLSVSAGGYQSRSVAVTLPVLADSTVDVTLDKVVASGLSINRVTPSKPAYDPFTAIDLDVSVQNATSLPVTAVFVATIADALGNPILEVPGRLVTVAAGGPFDIDVETHLTNEPAGTYSALVRAFDPESGAVLAEGSASFAINAVARMGGGITLDPPITQAGTNQAVKLSANISNLGNLPVSAGMLEMSVTLVNQDNTALPAARTEIALSPLSGSPLNRPAGAAFDAQGNFYTVNMVDRRVLKLAADGQVTIVATLPVSFTSPTVGVNPVDIAADSQGNAYVLNGSDEVFKVAPGGAVTRIRTNLGTQLAFDRDASGNLFIVYNTNGVKVARIDTSGGQQTWNAEGVGKPWGIARGLDGNLYVADQTRGGIAKVAPDGTITGFLAGGLGTPHGMAADGAGTLYVANSVANTVLKVTGGVVSGYATGLNSPSELAMDAQQAMYVINYNDDTISRVPPGGGAAQLFARTLVTSPNGMTYDGAGNLYVAGGTKLVKLDAAENSRVLATTMSTPRGVAAASVDDVFVANYGNGTITRTTVGANGVPTTTTFAANLASPNGLALGAGGTLYATETLGNRILAFDASGQKSVIAESAINSPRDIHVAPNGDRYVLNSDFIARAPAAGGSVTVLARGGFNATSFAPTADGGFVVVESTSIKRVSATGVVSSLKSGLPQLAYGVVVEAAGTLLVADQNNRLILRVDAAGNVSTMATLLEVPRAIVSDGAGGLYVAGVNGNIARVLASGAVSNANASSLGVVMRLAHDPVGGKIYYSNGSNVSVLDLSTRLGSLLVPSLTTDAMEFSGGALLVVNGNNREMRSVTPQGQQSVVMVGFSGPGALAWDGTRLYVADDTRILSLVPGALPQPVVTQFVRHLAWRGGVLYGTTGSTVRQLRLGVDTAFTDYLALTGTLQGVAARADGALSVGIETDHRVLTFDAAKQQIASYAGINSAAGIAVDSAGNVFVGSGYGGGQVVRISPSGKQVTVFSTGFLAYALAFDANGVLYGATASGGSRVVRFDSTGGQTLVASTTASITPRSLSVSSAGIFVTDDRNQVVWRVSGTELVPFAAGVNGPKSARVDANGNLMIASGSYGVVTRFSNGQARTYAAGLTDASGLAFRSDGSLVVAGYTGPVWSIAPDGSVTEIVDVAKALATSSFLGAVAEAPDGSLYVQDQYFGQYRVEKLMTFTPQPSPPVGTVALTRTATFSGVETDSVPVNVDFGTWVPPYGGDFRIAVRLAGSAASGEAVNMLHVGPYANAKMSTQTATVPPGTSPVNVKVDVTGADFTSLSKVDPANISAVLPANVFVVAMGADAAGNLFYTGIGTDSNRLRRYTPGVGVVDLYTQPAGQSISMRGLIPVDDQQNAYISGGAGNKNLIRVAPDGTGTVLATLPETIVSLARTSGDVIYVLGTTRIYRFAPGQPYTTLPLAPLASTYAITSDGRDNLYVQSYSGDLINMIRPDGTMLNVLRPGANGQPTFEEEGMNISGDCADNLFVTPYWWQDVGQNNTEEYTLVQLIGRTGRAAQVLDGRKLNPQITDLDFIAYDRFSQTLLLFTDIGYKIYRIPVTCGAISTDLHVVFAAGQPAGGFSVSPSAVLPRTDGSVEYVWSLKDVTDLGKVLSFTTTLSNLKLGDVVPVASSASLVFKNTFVEGNVTVPVAVPTVGVDGMVDISVATDLPQYDANTDVVSTVRLDNRDGFQAKSGTLTVEVVDPRGVRVAIAGQQAATLPPATSLEMSPPFNTGTYLTGNYTMKATLVDALGAVVASASAGFDIVSSPVAMVSSVATDKTSYEAFDNVNITARVRNVSYNAIATDATVQVAAKDPSGQVLLSGSAPIALLVPQALKDSPFTLRLSSAPAGTYTVEEKLLDASGRQVDARSTTFTVLSSAATGSGLRGAVTATHLANVGDPVTITVTLKNQGNAPLAGMPLNVRLVNPVGGALVQQWTTPITLGQGAEQQVAQIWTSTGAAAGTYIAIASATTDRGEVSLGQDAITLGAIQPFAFPAKTNVPLNAFVQSDPVTLAGIVAPAAISIVEGEYRVGNGGWSGAPGFVSPGETVTVRLFSGSTFNATTTAVLTVAGFSAPFAVTTLNPDVSPNPFAFDAQANVPLASLRVSNEVTIGGIDIPVAIAITGGEYRIDGGAWTSATGMVASGQKVEVRLLSSSGLGTTTSATLTVSDFSAAFSVTTTAEDRTPDPFAFTAQTNVPLTSLRTSNTVTITGINVRVPISVTGGEYKVGAGEFTALPGTIGSGETVSVRHTSAAAFSTTVTTRLTVSDVTASFESSTEGEDRSPEPFAFAAQLDVPLVSERVSNTVAITGINTSVPISVQGGEYRVGDGSFTAVPGTVKSNDQVTVRQTSSSSFATQTTATLTVSELSVPFQVTTKAKADVKSLPAIPADGRVLVLLSCKLGGGANASDDPACLAQRQAFLDGYLTQLGVLHTIVTTPEEFRAEFRSGRYNVYWISGGAIKLKDTLAPEVREATFRGETLIVDGTHDERNSVLDEALGVFYKGKPAGLATVTLGGGLMPSGTFTVTGSAPIRVELLHGERQARFNTGDPAISTGAFGLGKSLLFSFDLTGTLFAQSASALLRDVLDRSIDWATPAVPAAFTGGAYLPLMLTLRNSEPVAVDLTVTATLPPGFALAAGAPPATLSGTQVTWQVSLEAGASKTLDWAVRTPEASGSYSIPLVVRQVYGTAVVELGTPSIPVDVRGLDAALPAVIAQLQSLAIAGANERNARDAAIGQLVAAQSAINATRWEDAIGNLVTAVDKLDAIGSVPVGAYQAAIGNVMKEVERRWWSALLACPASGPCRAGS